MVVTSWFPATAAAVKREEELGHEDSDGLFPMGAIDLFWEEVFENFQAGAGLDGAAESSDRFWKSLRAGRGFSEDCCSSRRCGVKEV